MRRRKRIALFLGEIGRDYQKKFINELRKVARSKDYDIFVFNNFGAYNGTALFDLGERDVINIPVFSEFEGIISLADTYDIDGMEEMLLNRIRKETDCPVVSVRNGSHDTYRVVFDNFSTLYEMTDHFIKEHGFKNICYMSGPLSYEDSVRRLEGFKKAMSDAGLEVTDDILFEGDFWKRYSKEAADKFLAAYDGKTEAIICANDYMALGLMEVFEERGIKVPDDIAISGFDEIIEGVAADVPLTTVAIPVTDMVTKAVDIIEEVNSGKVIEGDIGLTGKIIPKASCGCCFNSPKIDYNSFIHRLTDEYVNVRRSTQFITDIQNQITEVDKLKYVNNYNDAFRMKKMFLCLCMDDHKDDNPYSETMLLKTIYPFDDERMKNPLINYPFPRKDILPEKYFDYDEPSVHIVFPIHYKNTTFGYLVSEWSDLDITIFIAPYGEGIAHAYNDLLLQDQFSEFVEMKKQNLVDPLTGISNRRGFEQSLNNLILQKHEENELISFLSVDLDNLKTINDTYGHSEGDVAIRAVADVLAEVVTEKNICARAGGDEFYAIISSTDPNARENTLTHFYELLDKKNTELNKQYDLHASVGIYTVKSKVIDRAFEHLQMADRLMYEAKRKYKAHK